MRLMTIQFAENKIQDSNLSVIEATGSDSIEFLHAQFTGDCKSLVENQMMFTSWCSPKGRVLYLIRIIKDGNRLFLLVPAHQKDGFLKRLQMFVFRSKVKLVDCSESHAIIICHGQNLPDLILPDGAIQSKFTDYQQWIITPTYCQQGIWDSLKLETANSDYVKVHDVHHGIPSLPDQLFDQFLPQEINLEHVNGLSFEKGCYPGQEIIARVKYRGKVKRSLRGYNVDKSEPIEIGSKLIDAEEKPIGTVIQSITTLPDHQQLLAVVNIDCEEVRIPKEPALNLAPLVMKNI